MKKILSDKVNWEKLRIRGKKDWIIFWIFAALICYGLSSCFLTFKVTAWLFQRANPYMTNLNDPSCGWGRLMITLLLLALVGEVVLFLCERNLKGVISMAAVLLVAVFIPFITAGAYKVHTDLIVSSLWKEEPRYVSIWPESDPATGKRGTGLLIENLAEEEKQQLLELCRSLNMITDEEELGELAQWYQESRDAFTDAAEIRIGYDERYGHSYSFILRLHEGKVFIWRGNGKQPTQYLTFFEDNGVTKLVKDLLDKQPVSALQSLHINDCEED